MIDNGLLNVHMKTKIIELFSLTCIKSLVLTKPVLWNLAHTFIQRSVGRCHKMTYWVNLSTVEMNT